MNRAQEIIVERLGINPNDPEARAEFDRFCEADSTFREEAALHLAMLGALKQGHKQHLRQVLEAPDMQVFKKQTFRAHARSRWLFRAVFVFVFLGIVWYLIRIIKIDSVQKTPENYAPLPQVYDAQPIVKQPVAETNPSIPNPNIPQKKTIHKRLFAQYFAPYDPSLFYRQTRGDKKSEHVFFAKYSAADYKNAVINDPVDSIGNTWLFYRANAWMAVEQPEKALQLMKQMDTSQNMLMAQQVKWYMALAYLQNGEEKTAVTFLQSIAVLPEGAYKVSESKSILAKLK